VTKKQRRSAADTREHVLDVAQRLFYWHGIRATGVDTVAREAEIAPTILYRIFPSKDALVAAYIERAASRYRAWFDEQVHGDTAAERVVALFDGLAEQTQPDRCRGCPFLMTLTEMPDDSVEAHRAAVRLKRWVRARIRRLVDDLRDADALADHLTLLFEGVYASVQALGARGPAQRARDLAAALVRGDGAKSRPKSRSGSSSR
jgi:AcrR family transcriptional regulator